MKHYEDHYNIEVIRKLIKAHKFRKFALVKMGYNKGDEDAYYIAPLKRHKSKLGSWYTTRYGAVYDNTNVTGDVMLSKEELCMKFTMLFGFPVKYILEDNIGITGKI